MRRVILKVCRGPFLAAVFLPVWIGLLFSPFLPSAHAQPPENSQPETTKETSAAAGGNPTAAAKPQVPKKSNLFLPSITIMPFGIDQIGLEGASQGASFFGLRPTLLLQKNFATALGTPITLQIGNDFTWMEYYDRSVIDRGIENLLRGGLGFPIAKWLRMELNAFFYYSLRSGSNLPNTNIYAVGMVPNFWIKATEKFQLKLGYQGRYMNFMNLALQVETAPAIFPSFDYVPFGQNGAFNSYASQTIEEDAYLGQHGFVTGFKYTPFHITTLAFDYEYIFAHYSNASYLDTGGHAFTPSLEQGLWKGATLKLKDEISFFTADKSAIGGASDSHEFNNMIHIEFDQKITKYLSFESGLRWSMKRTAASVLRNLDQKTYFFLGMKFHI